ncbi:hypothetical protein Dimus_014272 [Dionaea muscipula]
MVVPRFQNLRFQNQLKPPQLEPDPESAPGTKSSESSPELESPEIELQARIGFWGSPPTPAPQVLCSAPESEPPESEPPKPELRMSRRKSEPPEPEPWMSRRRSEELEPRARRRSEELRKSEPPEPEPRMSRQKSEPPELEPRMSRRKSKPPEPEPPKPEPPEPEAPPESPQATPGWWPLPEPPEPSEPVLGTSIESDSVPHESEWVVSIKEKLEEARQIEASSSWGNLSIYRIPLSLKDPAREKSYIPQVVSLGPYHHGRSSLKEMEQHKWRALDHILNRHGQDIKIYLDAIKEVEEEARTCYERPVSTLSSKEFVQMMVLDGCFMLELFRGAACEQGFKSLGYEENDPVFTTRNTFYKSIERDMIMLENQIPLFVLEKLLSLQLEGLSQSKSKGLVARVTLDIFRPLMPTGSLTSASSDESGLHCLDVIRRSLLKGFKPPPPATRSSPLSKEDEKLLPLQLLNNVLNERRQQLIPASLT